MHEYPEIADAIRLDRSPWFILIDYADRWDRSHLEQVLDLLLTSGRRQRLLLLGRSQHSWPGLSNFLLRRDVRVDTFALPALEPGRQREAVFKAAIDGFGAFTRPEDPVGPDYPDLYTGNYQSPLSIQMAALAWVLAKQAKPTLGTSSANTPRYWLSADPAQLTRFLLDREIVHWQDVAKSTGSPVMTESMARTVFVATLMGPSRITMVRTF